jgi:hypothetical protein
MDYPNCKHEYIKVEYGEIYHDGNGIERHAVKERCQNCHKLVKVYSKTVHDYMPSPQTYWPQIGKSQ